MTRFYFIDFEASSLSDLSHPLEVAWVDLDGQGESWLISPAPDWTDWSSASEAVLGCCWFDGHEDKIVTHEPEIGYDETEVQPRVQD